jgi:IS5 family transposase
MHHTKKGNQWYHRSAEGFAYGIKAHNCRAEARGYGVGKGRGLLHSVESIVANVHDLTPAAELLHREVTVVYVDAGYQGIEKRPEMKGKGIAFRVAMRPGKRRALTNLFLAHRQLLATQ